MHIQVLDRHDIYAAFDDCSAPLGYCTEVAVSMRDNPSEEAIEQALWALGLDDFDYIEHVITKPGRVTGEPWALFKMVAL